MTSFEYDIKNCLDILQTDGIILYPTDTIWGIGCDATNEKAVERIYKLKNRPDEKSMIILVADEKEISKYVNAPDPNIFNYLKNNTKPTTVIYHDAKGFAKNLMNKDGTIAMRICKDEFCQQMIQQFRKPIVSTSANISGLASPKNFSAISEEIKRGVDYIVLQKQEDKNEATASSIIKWENGKPVVIRP